MSLKETLIAEILDREFKMFTSVLSQPRSPCQDDEANFKTMRAAQFEVWALETLASYREDLLNALRENRNLMTLKYARMDNLISALQTNPLIDEIVEMQMTWWKELFHKYPNLMKRTRPLDERAKGNSTSFKTYLRGELETYSNKTLALFYEDIMDMKSRGENMTREIYLNVVKSLGYNSLEEAEEEAKKPRE
jgi:hypothetical protein